MHRSEEMIEKEVLMLPRTERARLANRLLESLEDRPGGSLRSNHRAWIDEANRRYESYLRGEEDTVPAQQMFDELRSEEN